MINDNASVRQDRLLTTLERLLELPATEVKATLNQAAQLVAEVLEADKVDIFFHDTANETLVSYGASDTPMARQQRAIGLDRLPLANGGRTVEAFLTGTSYISGHTEQDPEELAGIRVGLGVRSQIGTVFRVQGQHRGVLMVASATAEFFSEQDLRFLESVARWIGIVIGRGELVERKRQEAVEQGRRLAAEELLTIMAHDLRNYLTPMRGRLELLERRARQQERAQDLHDILAANNTLHQLERVIAGLLDVARLNQGTFAVDPQLMNLAELVQEVVTALTTEETPLQVQAPTEVLLSADPSRLRQLLENVLAMVVKYTSGGAPIRVEVHGEQREDGPWAVLTVSSQGSNIAQEVLESPFHPFVAGALSSGPGLGLYLARRIAEAHAGTLTLDSAPGQGVRFTLSVPMEEDDLGA